MFGYTRRGAEIRPSVCDGVAPMNPTPSTSRQGGTTNGRLRIGDRDGLVLTPGQKEEQRVDRIRLLVNQSRDLPTTRRVRLLLVEDERGIFWDSVQVKIWSGRVAPVRPLPSTVGMPAGHESDSSDEWADNDVLTEEDEEDDWVGRHLE